MRYRVIQWATGAMGTASLRTLIDHPDIDLVGLYVYSENKVGVDAGVLARRPDTGVLATSDVDEIMALEADVVVHSARLGPYGSHDADLIRLLESGKNVISINGYARPVHWAGPRLAALEAACAKGHTSLMSAGLNPGFVGEQLAVLATGLCSRVEHIEIIENADGRAIKAPEYLFGTLGFACDPADHDPNDAGWGPVSALNGMYEETVAAIAYRLGMTLERVESDHRVFAATEDLVLTAGTVPKGTVSHTNWRWNGIVDGVPKITMSIHWYVETTHLDSPDPALWQVRVTGQPGVRINVDLEKHRDDRSRMTAEQYALAGTVVNAIPLLCAADPGPVTRPIVTPFRADYATWAPVPPA